MTASDISAVKACDAPPVSRPSAGSQVLLAGGQHPPDRGLGGLRAGSPGNLMDRGVLAGAGEWAEPIAQ